MFNELGGLDIDEFAELIRVNFAEDGDVDALIERVAKSAAAKGDPVDEETSFAKRMLTGQSCERYFEQHYREYAPFAPCELKRTTHLGCGFDFKLTPPASEFLAVEVKGMRTPTGIIQMTDKEFRTAECLEDRFYLYVVANFIEKPTTIVVPNPLSSKLDFEPHRVETTQTVWCADISKVAS